MPFFCAIDWVDGFVVNHWHEMLGPRPLVGQISGSALVAGKMDLPCNSGVVVVYSKTLDRLVYESE